MTDLDLSMRLEATNAASPAIDAVRQSIAQLNAEAIALGKAIRRSLGDDLLKAIAVAQSASLKFTTELTDGAAKVATGLRTDVQAAHDLAAALKAAAAAQHGLSASAKATTSAISTSTKAASNQARSAATSQARQTRDRLRGVADVWKRRQASEKAEAAALASQAKAEAKRQRDVLDGVARTWRLRQASESAELRHVNVVRRERDAMRREMQRRTREVYNHGRHAVRSVNHPEWSSMGFWVTAGAAFGVEAGRHLLESAKQIDSAVTRYSMMPGVSAKDAADVRQNSLREGMRIGLDPGEVVRLQLQGLKDGLSPAIAKSLPEIVNAAVQTMGGSIERDGDELAKAVREASTVGWVKDATGARSLMNQVAGLSTFNGNSPEKMAQFLASGGIGRGKELGWNQEQTLAFGAAMNGSGERTGFGTARLMAQLPEIRALMKDRYVKAIRSGEPSEENRAIRTAPTVLGYHGGIKEMQAAFASPEGVTDFLYRLGQQPEQLRAAIERGYGLSAQFNAIAAEGGADHGARYKAALGHENQLAAQKGDSDDLSKNQQLWFGSIESILGKLKAGASAVQSEMGDVLKDDLLKPFTAWWINVSEALLDSSMKRTMHEAIQAFIHGLGFEDLTAALNSLRASVGTFDLAGLLQGIGEGLRVVIDDFRAIANALGFAGNGSARQLGKLAAEILGLSVALRIVAPVVTLLSGIGSAVMAFKAAFGGISIAARLFGVADATKAIAALDLVGASSGLMALVGSIGALIGAIEWAKHLGALQAPKSLDMRGMLNFLDPNLGNMVLGKEGATPGKGIAGDKPTSESESYWQRKKKFLHLNSFEGGDDFASVRQNASWAPSDSANRVRDASLETAQGVFEVKDSVDRVAAILKATTSQSVGAVQAGLGGGAGGGVANLRYGLGAAGGYRSTPGTGSFGDPSKSLLDFIAQSEGTKDYNTSLGFGKYLPGGKEQNLTGMTLNQILTLGNGMRRVPGNPNSSALGRYQITGQTLRDLMGRMHLSGSEKFDEKMQDALASKLIADEGPRALGRWASLKGGKMATAQGLLRSGQIASQPGDMSFNGAGGGGAGRAVDIALGMQGAGERQAQSTLGAYMHPGEWCADFVNATLKRAGIRGSGSAMASSFSSWGRHVDPGAVQKGDVITERHGNHVGHVGMATGNVQRDRAGNVTAVEMVSGNYGHMVKRNWEKIGIISDLRRSNEAITNAARKVIESTKPADLAKRVPSRDNPRPRPDEGDVPVPPRGRSADAGGGHTFNQQFQHPWRP